MVKEIEGQQYLRVGPLNHVVYRGGGLGSSGQTTTPEGRQMEREEGKRERRPNRAKMAGPCTTGDLSAATRYSKLLK